MNIRSPHGISEAMALTGELVALCHREVPAPERRRDDIRFADRDYELAAEEMLAKLGGDPIWVFAYGSLIWKPAEAPVERRLSTAPGWHRSFCLELKSWRGTPEQPGLMLALRRGGTCTGIAQRMDGDDRREVLVRLLRREIGGPVGYAALRLIDLRTAQGPVRALCFYAEPDEVAGKPELPLDRVASILSLACGHAGSCAEYLFNTVRALEDAGIRDPDLWRLQKLVATQIKARNGQRSRKARPNDAAPEIRRRMGHSVLPSPSP